jgi:DNA ligase 1
MKPMLAGEAVLEKLKFPLIASPKLDGLRGLVHESKLLSRSLKLIPNKHAQALLARKEFNGFDGELIVGSPTAKDVYRRTSSAIMGHDGEPFFTFYVFDLHNTDYTFMVRRTMLEQRLKQFTGQIAYARIQEKCRIVLLEQVEIKDIGSLMGYENAMLNQGYEGVILRNPHTMYKFGRSSTNEGILLKLKRFSDAEAEIIGFEEQMHNTNEATKNELGRTKRSTAKAGLVGKDTLGALVCRDLVSGVEFRIGTGMDDAEKLHCWQNQKKLMGKIVKYKSFKIGVKDAPRHPVFLGFRDKRDM